MIDLKGNPFYLGDEDIRWVEETRKSMTVEEKVYTPTFMMFVTKNDENYDEYMAVIEEVKTEYEGKVNFDPPIE